MRIAPRKGHIAVIFLVLVSLLVATQTPAQENLTFAVIGDTRIGVAESVYKQFVETVEKQKIPLVFITGDVIDRPGKAGEWERYLELTGKGKDAHIAPGNHDVNGKKSLSIYEKYIKKPPYYAFSEGDTQFIILCTEMPGETSRITGVQLAWLEEELKKPFAYRFVFLHKPLFPTTYGKKYGLDRYEKERDTLHALFVRSKVNAVIAGHEHLYNRSSKDGIVYVITGGGGARLLTLHDEYGGFFHYIIAKRSKGGYVFTVYDMNERIRDSYCIIKEVRNGQCTEVEKKED